MRAHLRNPLAYLAATFALVGCSGTEVQSVGDPPLPAFPERVVVTADWLNRSLTVFDYALLLSGAEVDEARWATIDLGAYAPGPLEVELTPDGKTAVVSVGPGFLGGGVGTLFLGPIDVPAGGTLLLVDLPSRSVRAEVKTAEVPMGIAISPDGLRAFTANFGEQDVVGHTISVIDLEAASVIEEIEVTGRPEQITLRPDGALGMVSLDGEASTRTFDPNDIASTISPPVVSSQDPSGVAFAEGTDVGVVTNSINPLGYSLIDVSKPLEPTLLETVTKDFGVPFAASRIPGTTHLLLGGATGAPAQLVRVDCGVTPSVELAQIPLANERGGFALGAAVDREGKHAFVAIPGDNSLQVVDLEAKSTRSLKWLSEIGPTYAALAP